MFITSEITKYLPKRLQAFKRYIEKYECGYMAEEKTKSIVFYHKETLTPYILVIDAPQAPHVVIYVNYQADNLSRPNAPLRKENFISNNMNAFLAVIRECKESNG